MGCSGSKKNVFNVDQHNSAGHNLQAKPDPINPQDPQDLQDEDGEAQVFIVSKGKSVNKTALDQMTENKMLQFKPQATPPTDPTGKQQVGPHTKSLPLGTHSKSFAIDRKAPESPALQDKLQGPHESNGLTDMNDPNETAAVKSNTLKLDFKSHPHEFDFSFIEEQSLKEQVEKDLLAEELLKEMSEIN